MELSTIDSSKLLFDIHSKTFEEDIKTSIPEFAEYDGPIPLRKIATYIALMYDPNSPVIKLQKDYISRKKICAELAGLPKRSGKWTKDSEDILVGNNKLFNNALIGYLRELALPEWTQLVAFHQLQENFTRAILSHEAQSSIHKDYSFVTDGILNLTRKIFSSGDQDEVESMRKALYVQIREDVKRLRPEMIAIELRDNKSLPDEWSPYADGKKLEEEEKKDRKKKKKPAKKNNFYNEDGSINMDNLVLRYGGDKR